jgi:hypothetical protein
MKTALTYIAIAILAFALGRISVRQEQNWQIVHAGNTAAIWKVNQTTGETLLCGAVCQPIPMGSTERPWENDPVVATQRPS